MARHAFGTHHHHHDHKHMNDILCAASAEDAAISIQRHYRGYSVRKEQRAKVSSTPVLQRPASERQGYLNPCLLLFHRYADLKLNWGFDGHNVPPLMDNTHSLPPMQKRDLTRPKVPRIRLSSSNIGEESHPDDIKLQDQNVTTRRK